MTLKDVAKAILDSNKVGICFHTTPDGDAVGSALGLLNSLRFLGKDAHIVSREVIPDNLSFLSLSNEIDGSVSKPLNDTDILVVLDCGNIERICADLEDYKGKIINVDHHVSNENYGYINYIEADSAATCELVYKLVEELGIEFKTNDEHLIKIGECIYTGIVTDTGGFRHSNVTRRTHQIAGNLISIGVKNNEIHSSLFENRPFEKLKLIGEALSSLELLLDNKVAYIGLPLTMLQRLNLVNVDTSDIISMALSTKDVLVAVVIKETEDGSKASLRSKKDVNVSKIAETLGGGGHIKASGVKLKDKKLNEAKEILLNEIAKEIKI